MTDDRTDPFPDEPEPEDLAPAGPDGPAREEGPDNRRGESTGVAWGAILLMLGIAIVVVFTVQNTDPVPVRFMWMDGQFPRAVETAAKALSLAEQTPDGELKKWIRELLAQYKSGHPYRENG